MSVTNNINDVSAAIVRTDASAAMVVERARTLGQGASDMQESLRRFVQQLTAA